MPTDVGGFDPLSISLRDVASHAERHRDEQASHAHVHVLEKEAIDKLANLVAAQRTEDAHIVEVALEAVQRAAQIHAIAHEQQHGAHQAIHDVEKEAIVKANEQLDRRLYAMNEFRNALRDQYASMMPRELATSQIDAVRREGQAAMEDLRGTLLTLHSRLDIIQGQSSGANATVGYFIAAGGLLLAVASVVITLALR